MPFAYINPRLDCAIGVCRLAEGVQGRPVSLVAGELEQPGSRAAGHVAVAAVPPAALDALLAIAVVVLVLEADGHGRRTSHHRSPGTGLRRRVVGPLLHDLAVQFILELLVFEGRADDEADVRNGSDVPTRA